MCVQAEDSVKEVLKSLHGFQLWLRLKGKSITKLSLEPAVARSCFPPPLSTALSLNFVLQSRSSMLTQMDEFFPPLSFISPMLNIIPIREVKIKIELHYNTAIGLLGIHPKHWILLEQFSHPCLLGLYLQHKGSGIKLNIHQRIWNE